MSTNQSLLPARPIQRETGNIASDMNGEKVLLNVNKGKYFNLGEIGGVIWELLEQPMSIRSIVDQLLSIYAVERATCEQQLLAFLDQLLDEGLIFMHDEVRD
ncbi:hypothetical protein GCM10011391_06270 [Pullulanibacillus camelliae]|uniref:Lasso peptide biosynthesis PqqD family chaperone n=1 Tax=Pullulanibacillus camelliae TaxID=1707096 RepID=A0A8J2VI38_9BACL|nr:hypothetical protein GCM10011391_06270 [Pullulanibacillus camelliae]